ncbi:MAG: hypothetical protein QW794_04010 [Thermosphaera sp.]
MSGNRKIKKTQKELEYLEDIMHTFYEKMRDHINGWRNDFILIVIAALEKHVEDYDLHLKISHMANDVEEKVFEVLEEAREKIMQNVRDILSSYIKDSELLKKIIDEIDARLPMW